MFVSKILIILIFLVNFSFQTDIYVDYDFIAVENYSWFLCGNQSLPCTNLNDANLKLINMSFTVTDVISIHIKGTINEPVSMGNLYDFCGKLKIIGDGTSSAIIVDGSNADKPFLSVNQIDNEVGCNRVIFLGDNIKFINWDTYPIVEVTADIKLGTTLTIKLQGSVSKSGNVIYVVPKGKTTYNKTISIILTGTLSEMVSSKRNVPGLFVDYLSPIHCSFVSLAFQGYFKLSNSRMETSPFLYTNNTVLEFSDTDSSFVNTSIENGHPFFMVENSNISSVSSSLSNCSFSTLLFAQNVVLIPGKFQIATIANPVSKENLSTTYLGNQYENGFFVYKNSIFEDKGFFQLTSPMVSNVSYFFIEKSNVLMGQISLLTDSLFKHLFFLNNSTIKIVRPQAGGCILSGHEHPIFGSESSIYIEKQIFSTPEFKNGTFCDCKNCSFYSITSLQNDEYSPVGPSNFSYTCPTPQPTPSIEPSTTTGVSATPPSSSTPDSSSMSFSSNDNDDGNTTKNIIIIVTILGSASLVTLTVFSIYFKNKKSKRYLLNSISNSNSTSDDGADLTAAAAADNDVSPNLEGAVVYDEDEDCAQLEKL